MIFASRSPGFAVGGFCGWEIPRKGKSDTWPGFLWSEWAECLAMEIITRDLEGLRDK